MTVEQLYTNCLSEAAYFITSDGEAAVIDPIRDYQVYIDKAEEMGVKIRYVFETHFHADFVSGHIDLAKHTGATIIYGPETKTNYPVTVAEDGQHFKLGYLDIEVLHTPGHTPESSCFLLRDEKGKPYCVFTGDTLFVADVGRPDLFDGSITKEDLAARLYESLNGKIKTLPDDVIVYPAHGAGSACGKNIGTETFSTIGVQKKLNYALQDMSELDFIEKVTEDLAEPPQYFPKNAEINKTGYTSIDDVLKQNSKALSIPDFEKAVKGGAIILDTRSVEDVDLGFIKGSVCIGLNGRFAEWVGTLFDIKQSFVLVTAEGTEQESILRMARVGYENVKGYLAGGFDAWKSAGKPIDLIISIDPDEFALDLKFEDIATLDVRKESEYNTAHVADSINVPLQNFEVPDGLSKNDHIFLYCRSGYRSIIAASLLRRKGFNNLKNVYTGFNGISQVKDIPIEVSENA